MAREHDMKLQVTDLQILAAIRYLDPDVDRAADEKDTTRVVIRASLTILVLGCLGLLWLYYRIS
jgi:hypothetical protein